MKTNGLVLIFVSLNFLVSSVQSKLVRVYKDCEATATNKSVEANYSCSIEFASKSDAFLNIELTLTRPIFDVLMNYEVKYRATKNKFRSVVKFDDIRICDFLNGTNINPLVIGLVAKLADTFKSSLHPCPYQGDVSFPRLPLIDSGQAWLRGPTSYKTILSFHDETDEKIFAIILNADYEDPTKKKTI